jgi:hypothetical protein
MAPKTAEKKVAGKAIAQKKGGKKGGKKRSVESWKIYIYKVCMPCCVLLTCHSIVICCCCCVAHLRIQLLHICFATKCWRTKSKGTDAVLSH